MGLSLHSFKEKIATIPNMLSRRNVGPPLDNGTDNTASGDILPGVPVRTRDAADGYWARVPTALVSDAVPGLDISSVSTRPQPKLTDRRIATDWAIKQGRRALFLVPAALLALILWVIWNRTADVPIADDWDTVILVVHLHEGTLTLGDLWSFHNEHRIFLPRIIELTLIQFAHWNQQFNMTVDLGFAVAEAAILLSAARRLLGPRWVLALVIPGSLLIFSLSQYQNWLWSFQITFILTVFGVACCMYGFTGQPVRWGGFILALVGAFVATLSSLGGIVTWVAFFPFVYRAGKEKAVIWVVCALGILIPYFQGFPHSSPYTISLASVKFALGYLGAPLGYPNGNATVWFGIGSLILAAVNIVVYRYRERTFQALDAWLGLGLYGLGAAAIIGVGRYNYYKGFPYGALGNLMIWGTRYQELASLWWLALLVITVVNIRAFAPAVPSLIINLRYIANRVRATYTLVTIINVAAIFGMCLALVFVNVRAWKPMINYTYPWLVDESCVANYEFAPDSCLGSFYAGDASYVRQRAAILDKYHLGPFYDALGTTRPLIRYLAPQGGHLVTTALLSANTSYKVEEWLGSLYVSQHPNTTEVFDCLNVSTQQRFLSVNAHCEGAEMVGTEGWIYTVPPSSPLTVPLMRCTSAGGYFESNDPKCEGQKVDKFLGYTIAQIYGYEG